MLSSKIVGDQVYRCTGAEPYTRVDGSMTELEIWESECARCGQLFTFKCPKGASRFSPNRRCEKHKRPGIKVRRVA